MTQLYVNPTTGSNTNAGTQQAPLKTITEALKKATSGTTILLAEGNYNASSGEEFPLKIPGGVTVVGNESNKGINMKIEGSGNILSPTWARQNITIALNYWALR